jgi:hypothetical protein
MHGCVLCVVRTVKYLRIRMMGHAKHVGGMRNSYILVAKPEGRIGSRWEGKVKDKVVPCSFFFN